MNDVIGDVYGLFNGSVDISDEALIHFKEAIVKNLTRKFNTVREPRVSMSNVGTPCNRKLWYEIHTPDKGKPMEPNAHIKFAYGDIIEEYLLFLVELAGHRVEGQQDECRYSGLGGHRDAVINGTLVDVKSCSTYSFRKFKDGSLFEDDPFGYVTQLQNYLEASQDDPLVTNKDSAYFIAMDKTLGHLCALEVPRAEPGKLQAIIEKTLNETEGDAPPSRGFMAEPEGKSGNMKLGVNCSYCAFKNECWPGLRTFMYSNRPVFLTKVVREPKVPEVK